MAVAVTQIRRAERRELMHSGGGEIGHAKRMCVSKQRRGLGIGRKILSKLEEIGREHGLEMIRLETHEALAEALAEAGMVIPPSKLHRWRRLQRLSVNVASSRYHSTVAVY